MPESQVSSLISQYNMLYNQYLHSLLISQILLYSILLIPIIVFLILYKYRNSLSNIYYRIWYQLNKNRNVSEYKKGSDEISKGIVLGLIILVLIFAFGMYSLNTSAKQGFSEMLLLNSDGAVGNYPCHLISGEKASVILLLENHEGKPMLYNINVIAIGQTKNITISQYYYIIKNNNDIKVPINFSIDQPGIYKLRFVLYEYNIKTHSFIYSDIFTQLILNVTQ